MDHQEYAFKVETYDQISLQAHAWVPSGQKQQVCGVVWLVHGFGEHSGRYSDLIQRLCFAGFAVVAYDHRGHGRSSGARGCAPDYQAFLRDLSSVRLASQQQPWYQALSIPVQERQVVWAHSFGGGLALNYLLRACSEQAKLPEFRAYLITSPWLRLSEPPNKWLVRLASLIHLVYPSFVLSSKLVAEHISSDPAVQKAYSQELADPSGMLHGKISYQLFSGAVSAGEYVLKHANTLKNLGVPVRLVHGAMDKITSTSASAQFAEIANQGAGQPIVELDIRASMRHETHHELDRVGLIEENINWLQKNCCLDQSVNYSQL